MQAMSKFKSLLRRTVLITLPFGLLFVMQEQRGTIQAQTVSVIQTTADQTKLLTSLPNTQFGGGGSGSYTLHVDATRTYQSWDGVGASMTDSANWLIWKGLTVSQKDALLQQLFTPSGAGFDAVRMVIGASDASASGNYSYDDNPPGGTDSTLANFDISHDLPSTIPAAQEAYKLNPNLKIFALPWSPPGWMKSANTSSPSSYCGTPPYSNTMNGGYLLCGSLGGTPYTQILANYIVKFVQAYHAQGLPIYAVTAQTEPGVNKGYPSTYLDASDEAVVYNYLRPALNAAGYSTVKILAYDWNWDNTAWPEQILAQAGANVDGSSFHCYRGDESAEQTVWNAYPTKGIWFTECTPQLGENFGSSLSYWAQHLLIGNVRAGGKSVIAWNLALDQNGQPEDAAACTTCMGVVTINTNTSPATVTMNAEYYALGQVGKFVRPGALVIATDSQGAGGIQSSGFMNTDGSVVLFVLNGTTATSTITVSAATGQFDYNLPAGSLTTFKWQPK